MPASPAAGSVLLLRSRFPHILVDDIPIPGEQILGVRGPHCAGVLWVDHQHARPVGSRLNHQFPPSVPRSTTDRMAVLRPRKGGAEISAGHVSNPASFGPPLPAASEPALWLPLPIAAPAAPAWLLQPGVPSEHAAPMGSCFPPSQSSSSSRPHSFQAWVTISFAAFSPATRPAPARYVPKSGAAPAASTSDWSLISRSRRRWMKSIR